MYFNVVSYFLLGKLLQQGLFDKNGKECNEDGRYRMDQT